MAYNMVLNVKYLIVTSGVSTHIFRRTEDSFEALDKVPDYQQMLEYIV